MQYVLFCMIMISHSHNFLWTVCSGVWACYLHFIRGKTFSNVNVIQKLQTCFIWLLQILSLLSVHLRLWLQLLLRWCWRCSLQEGTEMLWGIQLRFSQQQVAFWEIVSCNKSKVADEGERNIDNRSVLVIQAYVDWNKGHPNDTVDQRRECDVPGKVILMKGFHWHEGGHER